MEAKTAERPKALGEQWVPKAFSDGKIAAPPAGAAVAATYYFVGDKGDDGVTNFVAISEVLRDGDGIEFAVRFSTEALSRVGQAIEEHYGAAGKVEEYMDGERIGRDDLLGRLRTMDALPGYLEQPTPASWQALAKHAAELVYNLDRRNVREAMIALGAAPLIVDAMSQLTRQAVSYLVKVAEQAAAVDKGGAP